MSALDPEQAILQALGRPVGRARFGPPGRGGLRAGIIEGGNWVEADLQTVRFLKFRETQRRRLYFVTFEGSIPHMGSGRHKLSELYPLVREADGHWTASGGAGGGDDEDMARSEPWVNLAGGGWRERESGPVRALPGHFYAGGRVHDAGREVARVQLRFDDGTVLEDDTDQGIVLFITDQDVRLPAAVVLLDSAGQQLATHPFPGV